MLSACKSSLVLRWNLLKLAVRNSYLIETAYFLNNWVGLLSAFIFTITYVLFINVIFSNVSSMAGYNHQEILFLALLGQLNFYLLAVGSLANWDRLIQDVNQGSFDLVLIKPVPSLFYVSLQRINLIEFLRDSLIPIAFMVWVIDWHQLELHPLNLGLGIVVFICGLLTADAIKCLLSLPVFWKGESHELSMTFYSLIGNDFPWEGLSRLMQGTLGALIPILVGTSIATSVMLGKSPVWPLTFFSLGIATLFVIIKTAAWHYALKNYTSASS